MKSDICKISHNKDSLMVLLNETEKAASYSNLDKKQSGRLRLLAEELVGMLPELLEFSDGEFWVESEGKNFELHTALTPNGLMNNEMREKLLSVSTSGKNASAAGIMAKIKLAIEFMLIDYEKNAATFPSEYVFFNEGIGTVPYFSGEAWSLATYRQNAQKLKNEKWDELERSIIANIADEVLVGIQGKKVEVVVKKAF